MVYDMSKHMFLNLILDIILNRPPSPFPDETPLPTDDNKENSTSSSVPAVPVNTYHYELVYLDLNAFTEL
jgi:hypothetical protein